MERIFHKTHSKGSLGKLVGTVDFLQNLGGDHTSKDVASIYQAEENQDIKMLAEPTHRLKGICGNMGETHLRSLAYEIKLTFLPGMLAKIMLAKI